jgi:hypothetical protein
MNDETPSPQRNTTNIAIALVTLVGALAALALSVVALRAPNKKRFWDAVVVDGVYGETFGQ